MIKSTNGDRKKKKDLELRQNRHTVSIVILKGTQNVSPFVFLISLTRTVLETLY